ncbi:MAG TPA: hypothetical protein VIP28_05945 [Nocardioides sp.]
MSPAERLEAAADRIEGLRADMPKRHQDPWSGKAGHAGWTSLVSEAWQSNGDGHRSFVSQVQEEASAAMIVAAVNAMPALAEWLTCAGEDLASDAATEGKSEDDYIEHIPFYRLAVAIADQILGGGQ